MTTAELRAKRTALIADARAINLQAVTPESRSAFDTCISQADAVAQDILRSERMDALETEERSFVAPPRGQVGSEQTEVRTIEQRTASYDTYLRTGAVEQRDLLVSANGILIPTLVADPKLARKSAGFIYDLVGKLRTQTGAPVKSPLLNDTGNGFVLNSVGVTVTDPTVAGVTISVSDYRSNPILIDNSLTRDSGFDIGAFVNAAIQTRYLRSMSSAMTLGDAGTIGGLTSIVAGVQGATTNVIGYADFVSLMVSLDPAYAADAVFCMSNVTLGKVLNIVDTQQRPIFTSYTDGGNSGFVGTILGFKVKLNQYLPVVATGNKAVQFGDFAEGYCFREVLPGISVSRLSERYAELNKVGYVAFASVGGAVTDAGTSPIVSLTIK